MNQRTVSVFRLTFTSLTEVTAVTLNGKVIGEYHPRIGGATLEEPAVEASPRAITDADGFGRQSGQVRAPLRTARRTSPDLTTKAR